MPCLRSTHVYNIILYHCPRIGMNRVTQNQAVYHRFPKSMSQWHCCCFQALLSSFQRPGCMSHYPFMRRKRSRRCNMVWGLYRGQNLGSLYTRFSIMRWSYGPYPNNPMSLDHGTFWENFLVFRKLVGGFTFTQWVTQPPKSHNCLHFWSCRRHRKTIWRTDKVACQY